MVMVMVVVVVVLVGRLALTDDHTAVTTQASRQRGRKRW